MRGILDIGPCVVDEVTILRWWWWWWWYLCVVIVVVEGFFWTADNA